MMTPTRARPITPARLATPQSAQSAPNPRARADTWTPELDAVLIPHLNTRLTTDLRAQLVAQTGRSVAAVENRNCQLRKKMGVSLVGAFWTAANDALLAPWVSGGRTLGASDREALAAQIGTTPRAIKTRVGMLREIRGGSRIRAEHVGGQTWARRCISGKVESCKRDFVATSPYVRMCPNCGEYARRCA